MRAIRPLLFFNTLSYLDLCTYIRTMSLVNRDFLCVQLVKLAEAFYNRVCNGTVSAKYIGQRTRQPFPRISPLTIVHFVCSEDCKQSFCCGMRMHQVMLAYQCNHNSQIS